MTKDSRRFNEREAGAILRRVAELHEERAETETPGSMSQSEIEEVVGDLGISKALVARAASELSSQDFRNRPVWWLGGKTDLLLEQTIGFSIDDANLDRMIEVLRRSFGDGGTLRVQGNARIWTATRRTSRRIQLTASQDGEQTTIRLEERMPVDARTTVGSSIGLGFFLTILSTIPLKVILAKSVLLMLIPGIFAAGASLGWLVGRKIWAKRGAQRERQLQTTFSEILAIAEKPCAND